jgi:hypothetical protein
LAHVAELALRIVPTRTLTAHETQTPILTRFKDNSSTGAASTKSLGDRVEIRIRDNGTGIPPEVQCARLDVHELGREGKLKLGVRGWLFGAIWFEVTGGPDARQLVLELPLKSSSGEPLDPYQQVICCHWRKAHFGGRHLMFMCNECHGEARVLYARYGNPRIWFFNCRKCTGITYQSTMGHRWDRSARRVEKLRARLYWGAHGTVPIKPRGMHERTYQRILGMLAYHEAVRKRGASYARKREPREHSVHLWRQCRNRFAGLGGWPVR